MHNYLLVALCSFLVTLIATPLMIKLAVKFDITDHPNSKIKTHSQTTPYLGGAAVFLGFLFASGVSLAFFHTSFNSKEAVFFVLTTLIFSLGLYDDIKPTKIHTRLFIHLIVGFIAASFGFCIDTALPNHIDNVLSAVWIAGCINAMNIIDIMDGLASGVALFICISMMAATYLSHDENLTMSAIMTIALAGACLAFLIFNFEKAYFMWD